MKRAPEYRRCTCNFVHSNPVVKGQTSTCRGKVRSSSLGHDLLTCHNEPSLNACTGRFGASHTGARPGNPLEMGPVVLNVLHETQLGRLQSRSDQRSDSDGGSLNSGKQILPGILDRQDQEVAISPLHPFGRKPPLAAQSGDVPLLHVRGRQKLLERPAPDRTPTGWLPCKRRGPETPGRDLAQGVRIFDLSQQKFLGASVAVKTPHRCRGQRQVGGQRSMIGVLLEGEQALLNLLGLQRYGPAQRHKTMLPVPMEGGISELARLPAPRELVVPDKVVDNLPPE